MTVGTFRKALSLLNREERRHGKFVLAMLFIMALLETAGVASVMPFLALLGNPELVQSNMLLARLYEVGGFTSHNGFLLALGLGSFALIVFSSAFRIATTHTMNRFIEMRRHSIGERLLETYLRQPYSFYLNRHSSDMTKSILSEVDYLIHYALRPSIQMVAYGVVLLGLVALLLILDPMPAIIVATVMAVAYAIIFLSVRGLLGRIGGDRVKANRERFAAASEALMGIKDIKLYGREHAYLARFREPSFRQAHYQATNQTLAQVPKYIMEAVGFGSIIALTLVLLAIRSDDGSLGAVLPILGVYAFAGYRMLPAAQQIYQGLAKLRFSAAAVDSVYQDLKERRTLAALPTERPEPLVPRVAVALKNISFTYPYAPSPALKEINLVIPTGSCIGLAGPTGSGKTTLVDLILGLLRPTEGAITIDGVPVTEHNLRAWQEALGYVPQGIFLTDNTITANIAFGVAPDMIDQERVVRSARAAQVHDFIMGLPDQYGTMIGERGVRLSGGQRQRLGIARALYNDPPILVLDEATSALDLDTERQVMAAIEELSGEKTIILIAHQLSTLCHCDRLISVENGHICELPRPGQPQVVKATASLEAVSSAVR